MSEVGTAVQNPAAARGVARQVAQGRISELKVSGHLMTLETGVFCVFQAPGSAPPNDRTGLPGVRISLPPGPAGRPEAVSISTFREDGWLNGADSAALVRVSHGPAQVLVTVYQAPSAPPDTAPRLQVMRLGGDAEAPMPVPSGPQSVSPGEAEVIVHVQRTGDVPGRIGQWIGTRGSRLWIEGFSLTPRSQGIRPEDLEYQAVLGRGWLSPWIEGGKFCGSRGMALPLLGLKVRLKGAAAKRYDCSYSATFVDGSSVGPVQAGETCEAESLAALEAFEVVVRARGGAEATEAPPRRARTRRAPAAEPAGKEAEEPVMAKPAGRKTKAR